MKEWCTNQPINDLPKKLRYLFKNEAKHLIAELKLYNLEVILTPAPEQKHYNHQIRRVVNRNPIWYREFYSQYKNFRRDRSFNALKRILKSQDGIFQGLKYKYDAVYRDLIYKRLIEGYIDDIGLQHPASNYVRNFFNMNKLESIIDEIPF